MTSISTLLLPLPTLTGCVQRIPSPLTPTGNQSHTRHLVWAHKADTGAWWEEEKGQEYIQLGLVFRTLRSTSAGALLSLLRTLTGGARVSSCRHCSHGG